MLLLFFFRIWLTFGTRFGILDLESRKFSRVTRAIFVQFAMYQMARLWCQQVTIAKSYSGIPRLGLLFPHWTCWIAQRAFLYLQIANMSQSGVLIPIATFSTSNVNLYLLSYGITKVASILSRSLLTIGILRLPALMQQLRSGG
jgi:hypothetical protein